MNVLIWIVTIAGVIGAGIMLGVGLRQAKDFGSPVRATAIKVLEAGKEAVKENAELAAKTGTDGYNEQSAKTLEAQSDAVSALGSALEGMAKFAEALKDLDAATRHYLVSVVFLLVAVVAASVGQIAG